MESTNLSSLEKLGIINVLFHLKNELSILHGTIPGDENYSENQDDCPKFKVDFSTLCKLRAKKHDRSLINLVAETAESCNANSNFEPLLAYLRNLSESNEKKRVLQEQSVQSEIRISYLFEEIEQIVSDFKDVSDPEDEAVVEAKWTSTMKKLEMCSRNKLNYYKKLLTEIKNESSLQLKNSENELKNKIEVSFFILLRRNGTVPTL